MTRYKLTYFDFSGSRGEECRIALHLAEADFEDHRLAPGTWPALKPTTPFGSLPILEVEGRPALAESNAILTYVGREHGLHPRDAWEAARHEAVMSRAEELRTLVGPSGAIEDPEEKKRARQEFAAGPMQTWAKQMEAQIRGPFVGGERIQVADVKLYLVMRAYRHGVLEHVPTTVFDAFPRLTGLYEAVEAHPRVASWVARTKS